MLSLSDIEPTPGSLGSSSQWNKHGDTWTASHIWVNSQVWLMFAIALYNKGVAADQKWRNLCISVNVALGLGMDCELCWYLFEMGCVSSFQYMKQYLDKLTKNKGLMGGGCQLC